MYMSPLNVHVTMEKNVSYHERYGIGALSVHHYMKEGWVGPVVGKGG